MKTQEKKQKAIELAYGIYWEKVKDFVDENGWFDNGHQEDRFYFTFGNNKIDFEYKKDTSLRPKSLSGIENNNNWTVVNSEEDLPNDLDICHFIPCGDFNKQFIGWIDSQQEECYFIDNENYSSDIESESYKVIVNAWLKKQITHYQPITKPSKPIY